MNSNAWVMFLLICGCGGATSSPVDSIRDSAQSKPDRQINRDEAPFNAESNRAAVAAWHTSQDPSHPLQTIEVFPVPDASEFCLAICDHQLRWWGIFGLYRLEEGHVVWQASCEEKPTEQSVHWLRGLKLAGFTRPIIEVYGQTHMGNGSLYLYELRDQTLVLLLQTRAVDSHVNDHETFQDDRLMAEYADLNGDGFADLLLKGAVEKRSNDGDAVVAKHPCEKVFLWNIVTNKFEEDRSRRIGLSETDN